MGDVILVVDDEVVVRRYIERVLKNAQYCVHTASTAAEAISFAEILGPELDLLITDVFLPESSGIAVTHAVRKVCPTVKVILISGAFIDGDETPFKVDGDYHLVLPKPFTGEQLLSVVARAINQGDSTNSYVKPT